jgi:hypothetical protein
VFYCSRDRAGEHPQAHFVNYSGIFQADTYGGYALRTRPHAWTLEAACFRRMLISRGEARSGAVENGRTFEPAEFHLLPAVNEP